MDKKNIIISVYTNASGFLWSVCKVDSGTDLGWCGDNKRWDSFETYEDALENAIDLIDTCDLSQYHSRYKKDFHWGNYVSCISSGVK